MDHGRGRQGACGSAKQRCRRHLPDLQIARPQAVAGAIVDDLQRPRLLGEDPPDNAIVYSIDEKSGMQAKSRTNPTKPAIPGVPARQEFEYKRHGTAVLYAALEVHDGGIDGWVADSTRSDNFVAFLADLVQRTAEGLELHCIVDNLSAHSTPPGGDFLG